MPIDMGDLSNIKTIYRDMGKIFEISDNYGKYKLDVYDNDAKLVFQLDNYKHDGGDRIYVNISLPNLKYSQYSFKNYITQHIIFNEIITKWKWCNVIKKYIEYENAYYKCTLEENKIVIKSVVLSRNHFEKIVIICDKLGDLINVYNCTDIIKYVQSKLHDDNFDMRGISGNVNNIQVVMDYKKYTLYRKQIFDLSNIKIFDGLCRKNKNYEIIPDGSDNLASHLENNDESTKIILNNFSQQNITGYPFFLTKKDSDWTKIFIKSPIKQKNYSVYSYDGNKYYKKTLFLDDDYNKLCVKLQKITTGYDSHHIQKIYQNGMKVSIIESYKEDEQNILNIIYTPDEHNKVHYRKEEIGINITITKTIFSDSNIVFMGTLVNDQIQEYYENPLNLSCSEDYKKFIIRYFDCSQLDEQLDVTFYQEHLELVKSTRYNIGVIGHMGTLGRPGIRGHIGIMGSNGLTGFNVYRPQSIKEKIYNGNICHKIITKLAGGESNSVSNIVISTKQDGKTKSITNYEYNSGFLKQNMDIDDNCHLKIKKIAGCEEQNIGYKAGITSSGELCAIKLLIPSSAFVVWDQKYNKYRTNSVKVLSIFPIQVKDTGNNQKEYLYNKMRDWEDCAICLSNEVDAILVPCNHPVCMDCWAKYSANKNVAQCPTCRISVSKIMSVVRADDGLCSLESADSFVSFYGGIKYEVNSDIYIQDFDGDFDRPCSNGIHYHSKVEDIFQWFTYLDIPDFAK